VGEEKKETSLYQALNLGGVGVNYFRLGVSRELEKQAMPTKSLQGDLRRRVWVEVRKGEGGGGKRKGVRCSSLWAKRLRAQAPLRRWRDRERRWAKDKVVDENSAKGENWVMGRTKVGLVSKRMMSFQKNRQSMCRTPVKRRKVSRTGMEKKRKRGQSMLPLNSLLAA